ncbi:unnamed protein product [Euphydryas editha]|uniref:Shootin-1 n=1 Tax=Euphydryas editha TaxID=104508 RepID=A0AAU9UQB9_EUPED|nr:unnamed protein product [Euphydryas editha]
MGELKSQVAELLHQRPERTTLSSSQIEKKELVEEVRASVIGTMGRMLDARFAGIEESLAPAKTLRPPLAADRRKEAADSRKEAAQKPKKKKSSAPKKKAPASSNESDGGEWFTVSRMTKKSPTPPPPRQLRLPKRRSCSRSPKSHSRSHNRRGRSLRRLSWPPPVLRWCWLLSGRRQ